jgi:hypothetical protein
VRWLQEMIDRIDVRANKPRDVEYRRVGLHLVEKLRTKYSSIEDIPRLISPTVSVAPPHQFRPYRTRQGSERRKAK